MNADKIEKWIAAAVEADLENADFSEIDDGKAAPRLSMDELAKARLNLSRWHLPDDFRSLVGRLCKGCRPADFFNAPSIGFLRDAWVLAEFARHMKVDRVRLSDLRDQWPDGYVESSGASVNVEITSATIAGRKLGKEYRFPGKTELDPVDDWVQRANAIPDALDKAIRDKAAKRYSSPVILVVYLNINEHGIRQGAVEAEIATIKQRHTSSFQGLHILWKEKLL
jgi:hypothetical protein